MIHIPKLLWVYRSAAGGWCVAIRWRDGWQEWRMWHFDFKRIH